MFAPGPRVRTTVARLSSALPPPRGDRVALSEVLSSLSRALDLTEGQPAGHTLRSCMIGMRLADELGLPEAERGALYYALLLKDAGCSSNAARMAALFGSSDQVVKYRMKFPDRHHPLGLALETARNVGLGESVARRVRHFVEIARTPDMTRDLIQIRCDRGAQVVRGLGFPPAAAETVRHLDEHWNGRGYPLGLAGDAIPLLARIAGLAQSVEIFHTAMGRAAALGMARERRGSWFDPALVDRLLEWGGDRAWWKDLASRDLEARVVAAEPGDRARTVGDGELDAICATFAEIIDAKSPFTFYHSAGVASYARAIAGRLGMGAEVRHRIHRAGLLHDVGKLGVSSRILDKAGPMTAHERAEMERHPAFSWEILSHVGAFRDFAWTAALHHEKLDGSGYPWRFTGEQLEPEARILAVADVYEALTADRPYRAGMTPEAALAILARDAGTRLSAEAIEGLREHLRDEPAA
jgi:HD-GYP domain-containing protein (c-di-GMP phosphodiesterase class II)